MSSSAPPVVRTSDPRDIVVYAENVLGFRPAESVVVISLHGPRWRAGLVLRLDLADAQLPGGPAQIAGHLADDGAGRAVVLVVSDDPLPPTSRAGHRDLARLPHARLVAQLRTQLRAAGAEQVETWLLHRRRLHSYTCSLTCCPPHGLAVEDAAWSRMAAEFVLTGSVVRPDRAAWEADQRAMLAPAPAASRRAVEAAARAALCSGAPGDHADVLAGWMRRLERVAGALSQDSPLADLPSSCADPGWTGQLLLALEDAELRDAVLAAAYPDILTAWEGDMGAASGVGPDPSLDANADPRIQREAGALPRWALDLLSSVTGTGAGAIGARDRLEAGLCLMRTVVSLAAPSRRAEPLACLAWLLWQAGEGAGAVLHAELALAARPGHRLAALILQAVTYGVPPWRTGGVRARRS